MEKLIFDLQRFAVLNLTSTSIDVASGHATTGSKTLLVSADGALYVATTGATVGTLSVPNTITPSGATTLKLDGTTVSSINLTKQVTAGVKFGDSNTFTITDTAAVGSQTSFFKEAAATDGFAAQSASISGGALKTFTGLDVTGAGLTFSTAVTGTVVGSGGANSFALSNFTGTLDVDQHVTAFDAGTITLANSLTTGDGVTKIMGVVAAGGKYTKGKLSDGTEYVNASLGGSSKTLNLTGSTTTFNVIGTAGMDVITVASGFNHSVKAGGGADTITLASTEGKAVYIMGEGGNDKIESAATFDGSNSSIYGGAGNDAITLNSTGVAAKEILVNGEDGNDVILASGIQYSTILGGAGKDTITSKDATNTVTGGAGEDSFVMAANVKANISDYVYGTDMFSLQGATTAVTAANTAATKANDALKSDGTSGHVTIDGGNATITGSNGFFAVNLKDTAGGAVDLGWVGDNKTTINGSAVNRSMVLDGMTNDEGDLLVAGAKADTLYAGAGDSVYGGAGKDNISLVGGTAGVYVGIATNSGKDTVTGFTNGFDISTADAVYVVSGTASDLGAEVDSNGSVTVTDGTASLELGSLTQNDTTKAYELLVGTSKVAVAKSGEIIKADDLSYADYWIGTYDKTTKTGSGVDLSDVASVVNVNLDALTNVRDMTTVTGGSGVTSLIGSSAAESLVAATGSTTSLYGGAGNDTLVSSSDTKTEFFFMNGSGKDTIQGFLTGDTADVVNFFGSGLGSIVRSDASNVVVTTSDGSKLTIGQATSSDDAKINWVSGDASGVAKIASSMGGSLSYESDVTNYIGASQKDTLTVATTDGSAVNIWMDGSQGVSYSDIDVINASGNSGNTTIAGSATAETITGGSGNASLWGGNGKDADMLNSTSGSTTMFFYGQNQGNDVFNGSTNDVMNLYDLNLANVKSANIESGRVVFTTTASDTVTVNGVQTFQLADGTKWKADYSTNQWTQEA